MMSIITDMQWLAPRKNGAKNNRESQDTIKVSARMAYAVLQYQYTVNT